MDPAVPDSLFKAYYQMERELFAMLVVYLCQSPTESMKIIALWIWLERNVSAVMFIPKMRLLPHTVIYAIMEETTKCLNFLQGRPNAADEFELPLLEMLMEKTVSLELFHQYSIIVTQGIKELLTTVCGRAFYDINIRVNQINTAAHQILPTLNEYSQRVMYLTFSRGKPVPVLTLLNYLRLTYGGDNIVHSLVMQQAGENTQSLYARAILENREIVENIMQGRNKVRLIVDGNPVWARKFVPIRYGSLAMARERYNFRGIVNRMLQLSGTIIFALVEGTGNCLCVLNHEPLAADDREISLLDIFMGSGTQTK
ncbi:hypothetical protein ACFE04_012980 [Oxalis oulophora]